MFLCSCFVFLVFRFCFCLVWFVFVLSLDSFWCCYCYCSCFGGFLHCFVFVYSCLLCLFWSVFVVFVFSCCCFGLLLFYSLCLLEWSRCCSCFVLYSFVLFVLGFCLLCLFLPFLMNIIVFPAILVFWLNVHSISASHFSFWFLRFFLFCLLFVSRCSFVCVFSACCLALC